jgi:hypothetical protein
MDGPCFEIGLVGAGAISAGAYTGGVMDFMVQALDEWYAAKAQGDTVVPPHDIKLSVFSGASAGAITAALATGYLASDQPPVKTEADAAGNKGRNKLFDSWVDRIDIEALLQDRDLKKKQPVVSALDSTILTEIADSGLNVVPRAARRPYVADNFHLILTVTNLRGVPYEIELIGSSHGRYAMSLHADYVHFSFGDTQPPSAAGCYPMRWRDLGENANAIKTKLKIAALASGAFPIGLAPRQLSHVFGGAGDPYSAREWRVPTPESAPHACFTSQCIPAAFGELKPDFRYDYLCMDGGVMDNEPLELARRLLKGSAPHSARQGNKADRALLLIDPFPGETVFDEAHKPPEDLLKLVLALFGALKNQARFKAEELMLAANPQVYSRFMIAPSRDDKKYAIACGALGGFGGFLKRDFRKHDYFLGRRNAQRFFQRHFVLPEDNALFGHWVGNEALIERFCVRDGSGAPERVDGKRLLPIIPVVGKARDECFAPQWPSYTEEDLDRLCEQVDKRVELVLGRLVDQYFGANSFLIRFGASFFLRWKTDDIVDYVRETVGDELKRMGIIASDSQADGRQDEFPHPNY